MIEILLVIVFINTFLTGYMLSKILNDKEKAILFSAKEEKEKEIIIPKDNEDDEESNPFYQ